MENLILGTIVETRGARWRLVERRAYERCALVTLRGHDRQNLGETLRLLTPFDRLVPDAHPTRLRLVGGRAAAHRVAAAVSRAHPWPACWTAATAAIDLLSWQLEPALAVLAGATRVLLADEVGLGKTVQAALILAELSARGLVERTLILTPAGLRAQWAEELERRFGITASVMDQAALAREAAWLPPGANPWSTAAVILSSIDLVKRTDTLAAVDRVPFDLLIVDEAHHLTPESDRGALVARLAHRAPWVVLISATPHSGDARAFAFLRDIGATAADRLAIFRRSAPPRAQPSRVRLVRVRATPDERVLLDEMQQYARAIWSARGVTDAAARLVAIVLARRAASSAEAVLASLVRRRQLLTSQLGGSDQPPPRLRRSAEALRAKAEDPPLRTEGPRTEGRDFSPARDFQPSLPWEEIDAQDAGEPDSLLATAGLASADDERRRLDQLITQARRAAMSSSKPAWIARLLARIREPLIVFSEYRDTIEALRARFESMVPLAVLHGGLSPAARRVATTSFVDGHARLLLATDAGGEGLNLQARCRAVIDVELPWNPLRLAQRVGRVDRLGQSRRVHAMRLIHEGSVEETVLAHLYRRQANVDAGLGPLSTDLEARIAAAVLGDAPASLTMPAWHTASAPSAHAEAEVRRLQALRDVERMCRLSPLSAGAANDAGAGGVPVSRPRRSIVADAASFSIGDPPGSATARFAFEATLIDDAHRTVAAVVVPVLVRLSRGLPRSPRECLRALQAITAHVATSQVVDAVIAERLQRDHFARQAFGQAVHERVHALLQALRAHGDRWHQPALFDDRSTRVAGERASVLELHRAHLEHLASTLTHNPDSADVPIHEGPRLIGVWLGVADG